MYVNSQTLVNVYYGILHLQLFVTHELTHIFITISVVTKQMLNFSRE